MAEDTQTIVVVDDEEMLLTRVKSFLTLEAEYNVLTFFSTKEALDCIRKHDVNLVISDYLMPEMNGIAFLTLARQIKPEIPRIILTHYSDKQKAVRAMTEAGLFQYVERPLDSDDLLIIVRNALEKQELLKKVQEKIAEINRAYGELEKLQREIIKVFV